MEKTGITITKRKDGRYVGKFITDYDISGKKMLNDEHFKVMFYEQDSSKVFNNTDIKGGVVISYRSLNDNYGAIGTFTPYLELNAILKKVLSSYDFKSMSEIVITRTAYRLTDKMHQDYPEAIHRLSKGHASTLR